MTINGSKINYVVRSKLTILVYNLETKTNGEVYYRKKSQWENAHW